MVKVLITILVFLACQAAEANLSDDMIKMISRAEKDAPDIFGVQRFGVSLMGNYSMSEYSIADDTVAAHKTAGYSLGLDYRVRMTELVTATGPAVDFPVFIAHAEGVLPRAGKDFYGAAHVNLGYTWTFDSGWQITPTAGIVWYKYFSRSDGANFTRLFSPAGGLRVQAFGRSGSVVSLMAQYMPFTYGARYALLNFEAGRQIKVTSTVWNLIAVDSNQAMSSEITSVALGVKYSF